MKLFPRLGALTGALVLTLTLAIPAGAQAPVATPEALTILFTHDTHDHFYPDAAGVGGYTRLATALKEQRETAARDTAYGENGRATVTLDAGDFSMGSLFQTVYATDAPELRALGAMGYDAVTLGNHEFDYRPQGLADMLNAAKAYESYWEAQPSRNILPSEEELQMFGPYSGSLPALVQANYKTPKDPSAPGAQALAEAMENYPVTDYTVIEKPGHGGLADGDTLRIAVFGVMGVDSDDCAPMSGMALEPLADAAKRVVKEIQEKENPDYIICLSHSGTEDGKGEDYELAKAVDGIDVIISGHTHTTLDEPIQVNDTLIVSCGPYTQNLGVLTVGRSGGDGSIELHSYELLPIDGTITPDPDLTALAEGFKAKVDEKYLSQYDLGYDQVLARAEQDFTIPQTGDLIGNAYIQTVKELEGDSYVPIAFAVAPDGVIRGAIQAGEVTTSHAFDILSLGSGADGSPGYPLVSVYLTGKDLKNAFEVDASVSALMPAATLYGAGSCWRYNPHRMFLDRVAECQVTTQDGNIAGSIANDKLYRVVADLYSGQMLSTVKEKSFGLLSITPRNADGSEVTDFEDCIIHDGEGREVKAWYALAAYLKGAGAAEVQPVSKRADPSWNPAALLFPMGAPTALVLGAALVLILAVALIVRRVRRRGSRGYRPYRGK